MFVATAPGCLSPRSGPRPVPLARDPGPASSRAIDPSLARLDDDAQVRFLVDLREQVDLARLSARHDRERLGRRVAGDRARAALAEVASRGTDRLRPLLTELRASGLLISHVPLRSRSRIVVTARAAALSALRAHPAVAELIPEYDSLLAGASIVEEPLPVPPGDSWAIDALGVRGPWSEGVDGRGVVVGILDSGVDGAHAALAAGRLSGASWLDPAGAHDEPEDTVPHGTQVLACAVARPVGERALGVAPSATWAAALANESNGYNNVHMALAADWMLFEARPDVLLGAWGHGSGSCDARDLPLVEAFRAAGVVPVFAAGNGGPAPASGQTPAALSGLHPDGRGPLAVGAVDRNGRVLDESSRGPRVCGGRRPFPDVVAPGWLVPVPEASRQRGVTLASGTSMAVGFAGGVAALVVQAAPDMTVAEIEDVLIRTARDLPPRGPDDASGFGMLDARAAVAAAQRWQRRRGAAIASAMRRGRQRDGTFVSWILPSGVRSTRAGGARVTRSAPPPIRSDMPAFLSTRRTKPCVSANGGMPP